MTNSLYYGDNLDILREHVPDESVDLVYLDPPFNSNASIQRAVPGAVRARSRRRRSGPSLTPGSGRRSRSAPTRTRLS